jgi:hypothetical protein
MHTPIPMAVLMLGLLLLAQRLLLLFVHVQLHMWHRRMLLLVLQLLLACMPWRTQPGGC